MCAEFLCDIAVEGGSIMPLLHHGGIPDSADWLPSCHHMQCNHHQPSLESLFGLCLEG